MILRQENNFLEKLLNNRLIKELAPDFSYIFQGRIWKTYPDPEHQVLAVETRNDELHNTLFHVISMNSLQFLLKDFPASEPWWAGLAACDYPLLFINIFQDDQDPGKRDLQAYNFIDKTSLWTISGLVPVKITAGKIFGFMVKEEFREPCIVDTASGIVTTAEWPSGVNDSSGSTPASLHFPSQYSQGSPDFEVIKEYLLKMDLHPVKSVEYLEYSDSIIISYYVEGTAGLVNYLLIMDEQGNVLYHEKTGDSLPGPGSGIFFVKEPWLFYLENKNILQRLTLI